jgi:hypothetical protein
MHADPADNFLWRALAIFLLVGALFGVLLALLLIFKPRLLERVNRMANRWVSTQRVNLWLDRSISIEHWFYRHHRAVGAVVVLGASYMFIYFGILFDKAYTLQRLSGTLQAKLLDGLLDALVLGALVGSTVALIAGFFIWLRPSLLRGIEEEANRWVFTHHAADMLDKQYGEVDRFVERHAQRVGWLLLLGSIYLFFAMFRSLA